MEHAASDAAAGLERRGEAVVPAERVGGRRQRDDLHVGRRHHELAGIEIVEPLAGVDGSDVHRPDAALVDGRVEDLREIGNELTPIVCSRSDTDNRATC